MNDTAVKVKIGCKHCGAEMPSETLDVATQKPTWFGKYCGTNLAEIICRACYSVEKNRLDWEKDLRK